MSEKINNDIINNTVNAENQTREKTKIVINPNEKIRILFLGNSITLHETKPEIGWNHNWGMAASAEENDYVHIVLSELQLPNAASKIVVTELGSVIDSRDLQPENAP